MADEEERGRKSLLRQYKHHREQIDPNDIINPAINTIELQALGTIGSEFSIGKVLRTKAKGEALTMTNGQQKRVERLAHENTVHPAQLYNKIAGSSSRPFVPISLSSPASSLQLSR